MSSTAVAHLASDPDGGEKGIVATIVSISKTMRVILGLKVAELDLFAGQDDMILALSLETPIRTSALAATINVRPSTVSKMVDRMYAKGLVERTTEMRDARLTLVCLTPAGVEIQAQLKHIRAELDSELERYAASEDVGISVADLQGLDRVLAKRLQRLR